MPTPLHQDMARLAVDLASASTVESSVAIITSFAAETLHTTHAGVTLVEHGGKSFRTAGATGPVVKKLDELQHTLREGPCVDAAVETRSVLSNDLALDARWPRWGPAAVSLGFGSIASSEMHADGRRVGALNVYGNIGRVFTPEDAEVAQVLAHHAGAALKATGTIEGLMTALDSRTLIGQAQGILMERYDVDADRAFAILRRYSQDENKRLVGVAQELVDRRRLPQPQL